MKRTYPTDLTDAEWEHIEPFVPAKKCRGRQRIHSPREILNAVFYILRSGCPWRLLPREYPPWKTVYHYFRQWRINGTFEKLNAVLRERLRMCLGRNPQPSAGIVDSQSARTTGVGGNERGFDPAKKVEGRKRHLLVDTTEGLVLKARVHSAKVPDQDGIRLLLRSVRERFVRLSHLWVDAGYQGRGRRWVEEVLGVTVEVVRKPQKPLPEEVAKVWAREWAKEGQEVDWQRLLPPRGFKVLPRRWVVKRTFSWLGQNRRMSKDYERLPQSSEAFVYAAMSRLMVRRLPVPENYQTVYRYIYDLDYGCSSPFAFEAELPVGDYHFTIATNDKADNYDSAYNYFEVDTVEPKFVSGKPTGESVSPYEDPIVKFEDDTYNSAKFVNIYQRGSSTPLAVYRYAYSGDYDIELLPKNSLKRGTWYKVEVTTGVNDGANNLEKTKTWSFKTRG